jgi:hypothetical protein
MQKRFCRLGFSVAAAAATLAAVACDEAAVSRAATSSGPSQSGVVARVGEREITLDQVDEKARLANMKAFQELYEARKDALEGLVADALLEQEARAQGVSREDLEAKEIRAKVVPVDSPAVEAFYNQNRARLGGQSLEDLGPQIRAFLVSRSEAAARETYLAELRAKAKIDISLDPPRVPIQVAANERIKGPSSAPVTIVEYSDFQ